MEGLETQTSGILASPPAPRSHNTLLAPHWAGSTDAQSFSNGGGELGKTQIGDTGGCFWKDSSPLRAVYMTDHQRNFQIMTTQRGPMTAPSAHWDRTHQCKEHMSPPGLVPWRVFKHNLSYFSWCSAKALPLHPFPGLWPTAQHSTPHHPRGWQLIVLKMHHVYFSLQNVV